MFDNITFTLNHMNASSDEYKQAASRATEEVSLKHNNLAAKKCSF